MSGRFGGFALKDLIGGPVNADAVKELADRVRQERERDESMAPSVCSETTLVNDGPPSKKKRTAAAAAKNSSWADVVAPDIALPNARLPGNKLKSKNAADATLVMRALYDDAHALATALSAFEMFAPYLHLVLNEDGLSLQITHSSKTLCIELMVPRASFFCYDNLLEGTAVCVAVSNAAMRQLSGNATESSQTISFLYHQCGRADEQLHVLLNPRDNDPATAISVFYHFPHNEDEDTVQHVPDLQMQYEIRMDSRQFLSSVRRLAKSTSSIVLMIRQLASGELAFEMGGSTDTFSSFSLSYAHAPADVRTASQCTIVCLEPKSDASRLENFLNHRFLSPMLESLARFGNLPAAKEVVLQLGVCRDAEQGYKELRLGVKFPMRTDTPAPFSIQAWLVPEVITI